MVRVQAIGAWHAFLKPRLNGFGRSAGRKPQAVGEAEDVGVDRHRLMAERHVEHDICRLAANAGQLHEGVAILRHFSAMTLDQKAR